MNKKRLHILIITICLTLLTSSLWAGSSEELYLKDLRKIYSKVSVLWRVSKKKGSGRGILGKIDFEAWDVTDTDVNNALKNKYKLLWVSVSPHKDNFSMDVKRDEWFLVDEKGKKHKAINCINYHDQNFYYFLNSQIKELFMFYPSYAMGERPTSFFLFFEPSVSTKNFKKLIYRNAHLSKDINIATSVK